MSRREDLPLFGGEGSPSIKREGRSRSGTPDTPRRRAIREEQMMTGHPLARDPFAQLPMAGGRRNDPFMDPRQQRQPRDPFRPRGPAAGPPRFTFADIGGVAQPRRSASPGRPLFDLGDRRQYPDRGEGLTPGMGGPGFDPRADPFAGRGGFPGQRGRGNNPRGPGRRAPAPQIGVYEFDPATGRFEGPARGPNPDVEASNGGMFWDPVQGRYRK